jgi:hypothetical protein
MEQARGRKDIPALRSMTYLDSAGAGLPPLETNPGGGIVTFRAKKMEAVVAKL